MVYFPGKEKTGLIVDDPGVHIFCSVLPLSFPKVLPESVTPSDGKIFQTSVGVLQFGAALVISYPVEISLIEAGTLAQATAGMVKFATGGVET